MDTSDLKLLEQLVDHANRHHDGHITIFKFSTNWRVGFETPEGDMRQDNDLSLLPVGKTFAEAARAALLQPVAFYDIREASRANWDTFIASLDDDLADKSSRHQCGERD
jgi:hypothetical protein